jgi:hypothetical protein
MAYRQPIGERNSAHRSPNRNEMPLDYTTEGRHARGLTDAGEFRNVPLSRSTLQSTRLNRPARSSR